MGRLAPMALARTGQRVGGLAAAVVLTLSTGVQAAEQPAAPIDPAALVTRGPGRAPVPNFAGYYLPDRSSAFRPRAPRPGPNGLPRGWMAFQGFETNGNTPPPLKPEVFEWLKARQAGELTGDVFDEQTMKCKATLLFDMYVFGEVLDILQREDELVMIVAKERALPRHIFINGKHPPEEDLAVSPNGHAVAHWEGSELVIDTVGMADNTWLFYVDFLRHSEKLHVVERLSLSPDGQVITNVMTIEDPEYLTKPWTLTVKWRKAPPGMEPLQEPCDVDQRGVEPIAR